MSNTQLATLPTCIAQRSIDQAIYSALKSSIFPGASDESIALAYDYCLSRKLDILKKPCHIVPMNVKDAKTNSYGWRDVIMPGIAEARITAQRTGEYAGQDEPRFGPMVEINFGGEKHNCPEFCTVTVYRYVRGEKCAASHTEFFEEAANTTKDGKLNSMWTKRKRGQLAKCAEAGALRKAFPDEMGGIITAEEADDAAAMRDVSPKTVARTEAIDPFKTIEAPAAAPTTVKEVLAQEQSEPPQGKTSALDAPLAGFVISATQTGPDWIVVLRGTKKDLAVTAATFDIGERAAQLEGCEVWATLKKDGAAFILAGINLKEEVEESLL